MLVGCFSLHPHLALRVTFENQYTTESCLPFPKVAIKAHDHRDDRHPEQTDGPQRSPRASRGDIRPCGQPDIGKRNLHANLSPLPWQLHLLIISDSPGFVSQTHLGGWGGK